MERPLKVVLICHPSVGGSGIVASELGRALAERGHEIHIVSHRRPVRAAEAHPGVRFHEVEITRYPLFQYPPYTLALATKLAQICREIQPDLLHAHYAIPHAVSAYLCRQMLGEGAPKLVTTLHGTDITLLGMDESFYDITRFSLLESDALTAVSEHLAQVTVDRFELDCEVRAIHNFIDGDKYTPALGDPQIREQFASEGEALVGHLSNFRWVKRAPDVVRIFHRIAQKTPARLLMVGDGPELEPTRVVADELGILDRIIFQGVDVDAARLLAQMDLFLLPSEQESFGLAALEAMSCGVPVVASRVGGVPELIDEGSGYLFPMGDVESMATAAVDILSDPQKQSAMAAAARSRAVDAFSEDSQIPRYESLYYEVLGG